MREQDALARELRSLALQRLVVDVEVGERQRVQALADEQVGPARELDQGVGPRVSPEKATTLPPARRAAPATDTAGCTTSRGV